VLEDVDPAAADAVARPLDEELDRAADAGIAHAELHVGVGGEERGDAPDRERERQRGPRDAGDDAEDREHARPIIPPTPMLTAAASEIPLPGAAPECVGVAWWPAIVGGRRRRSGYPWHRPT
jgi:hypothetical protein